MVLAKDCYTIIYYVYYISGTALAITWRVQFNSHKTITKLCMLQMSNLMSRKIGKLIQDLSVVKWGLEPSVY